jgi:hypothetical protein
VPDSEGCTGEAYEPESIPLDIYVLFDQSGSMCTCVDPPKEHNKCPDPTCRKTRLDAVREALDIFMQDPQSVGVGLGITYFGYLPLGETSCDAARYAEAKVAIGELPGNAAPILKSLTELVPTGETPTGAAIEGACGYARRAASANPDHKVVMLVLTDGKPEAPVTCLGPSPSCCPTLLEAEQRAFECHDGDRSIPVYVLGVGPLVGNLDGIAASGGTGKAHLVPEDGNVDGLVAALRTIRGEATIPCEFRPSTAGGQSLDYGLVNITYADPVCRGVTYGYVPEGSRCDAAGGWYLDSSTSPPVIRLCPKSCEQVGTPGGSLLLTVGCQRVETLL